MADQLGASGERAVDTLTRVHAALSKLLWRFDGAIERWKMATTAQEDGDDPYDPHLPPDVPRRGYGPYQLIVQGDPSRHPERDLLVKLLTIFLVTLAAGLIAGAMWSHSSRIDKLEHRVDSLDPRISR